MDCSKWEVCLRTGTRGKHADSGRKSYYLRRCALNRGSPDCSDHSDLVLPWMLLLEAAPARSSVRWQPGAAAEPQAAQFSRRDREIILSRNPFGGQIYQKMTASYLIFCLMVTSKSCFCLLQSRLCSYGRGALRSARARCVKLRPAVKQRSTWYAAVLQSTAVNCL